MHLHLVSVLLNLSLESFEALLVLADEGVVLLVGLLLLFPLHGVLLGLVHVHLAGLDAAPPDVELVLTQLALKAPLLSVCTSYVELYKTLLDSGPGTALPGAGVADV